MRSPVIVPLFWSRYGGGFGWFREGFACKGKICTCAWDPNKQDICNKDGYDCFRAVWDLVKGGGGDEGESPSRARRSAGTTKRSNYTS